MEWSGRQEFASSPEVPFLLDGAESGILKTHGPLSFLKVCSMLVLIDLFTHILEPVSPDGLCSYLAHFMPSLNLSCLPQVHDAGHMVPMDQPKAALEMLRRWTHGQLVDSPDSSLHGAM